MEGIEEINKRKIDFLLTMTMPVVETKYDDGVEKKNIVKGNTKAK